MKSNVDNLKVDLQDTIIKQDQIGDRVITLEKEVSQSEVKFEFIKSELSDIKEDNRIIKEDVKKILEGGK
jgi:hypothetical protein